MRHVDALRQVTVPLAAFHGVVVDVLANDGLNR